MATFVLVHGTTAGGWVWKTIATELEAAGHTVYRPSLTGLGERTHLLTRDVGALTHITFPPPLHRQRRDDPQHRLSPATNDALPVHSDRWMQRRKPRHPPMSKKRSSQLDRHIARCSNIHANVSPPIANWNDHGSGTNWKNAPSGSTARSAR